MSGNITDLVSLRDLSQADISGIIEEARVMKRDGIPRQIEGKCASLLFFENSTRTYESHRAAAEMLGMRTSGFAGDGGTSAKKGERLIHTAKTYGQILSDMIVMRHKLDGSARFVADALDIPIINGGDGKNVHPTQTLLDLMTMHEKFDNLHRKKIALVGDLRYGRTVHSMMEGLIHYNDLEIYLVSPDSLQMPQHFIDYYKAHSNGKVHITSDFSEVLKLVDVVYMTRIQRERFEEGPEGEKLFREVAGQFQLTGEMVKETQIGVMHPLPIDTSVLEITPDVEDLKNCWYFIQEHNGVFIRAVIISKLMYGGFEGVQKTTPPEESAWIAKQIKNDGKPRNGDTYRFTDGTFIDHIEVGKGHEVLQVLGMDTYQGQPIHLVMGIQSKSYGQKDVVGIHNRELSPEQLSRIALISPRATVNYIADGTVVKKGNVRLPHEVRGLVSCANDRCVSFPANKEHAPGILYVTEQDPKRGKLELECHYCHTPVGREKLRLL